MVSPDCFISLRTLLNNLAQTKSCSAGNAEKNQSTLTIEENYWEHWRPTIEEETRISSAAYELNRAISQNRTNAPKAWRYDQEKGFHVEAPEVQNEVIELLTQITNMAKEQQKRREHHLSRWQSHPEHPPFDKSGEMYGFQRFGLWDEQKDKKTPLYVDPVREIIREYSPPIDNVEKIDELAFVQDEIVSFLKKNNINHGFEQPEQSVPVMHKNADEIKWTWTEMKCFTKIDRKTIVSRAAHLGIEFLEHPSQKGSPKKGLRESDLRRIINNK